MNWFQRHLNWTAVIVPIMGVLLGILIDKIFLLVTGMPYIPIIMFSFDAQVVIGIADIFSMIWFRWILKQKNRSWKWLLFFVPPLIPLPYGLFTLLFLVPFGLIGWIILLKLKNKST